MKKLATVTMLYDESKIDLYWEPGSDICILQDGEYIPTETDICETEEEAIRAISQAWAGYEIEEA